MPVPPMRPTFQIEFPVKSEIAINRLSELLNDADYPIEGRIAGTHLMLVIPPAYRHFWSPWLNIEVHEHEKGSSIHGRFSPNPSVWTGFMLTYISLATLIFFASMFGVAQWMMDKPPSVLKLIPIFIIIAGLMYWASLIGQKIAQQQMHELYNASMEVLGAETDELNDSHENRSPTKPVS
jgi:hypothetical protein